MLFWEEKALFSRQVIRIMIYVIKTHMEQKNTINICCGKYNEVQIDTDKSFRFADPLSSRIPSLLVREIMVERLI